MDTILKFHANLDGSVNRLKSAIERQIEVMEVDGKMNKFADPLKAEGYRKKLKKILSLTYFTKQEWLRKRVRTLNSELKDVTRIIKAQKDMIEERLEEAKDLKVNGVQLAITDLNADGNMTLERLKDVDERYKHADEEIRCLEAKLKEKADQYKEFRFLQGLINNPEFFSALYRPG